MPRQWRALVILLPLISFTSWIWLWGINSPSLASSLSNEANGIRHADEWEHTAGILVHTKEYQLKLNSSLWINRYDEARDFMAKLKVLSKGLIPFSANQCQEDVREQYHIGKTAHCGHREGIRARRYVWGHQANTTTLDMKITSQEGKEGALKYQLATSPAHRATSIYKFEQDIHPCKGDKWSQELRVTDVPFDLRFEKCFQLKEYFPETWNHTPELMNETVSMKNPEIWWQFEQHGRLKDNTKWKSAVTLKYKTIEEAISGSTEPLPRGEWSLRVYAGDDGTGEWNHNLITRVDQFYRRTIEEFGSVGEWPCELYMDGNGKNDGENE